VAPGKRNDDGTRQSPGGERRRSGALQQVRGEPTSSSGRQTEFVRSPKRTWAIVQLKPRYPVRCFRSLLPAFKPTSSSETEFPWPKRIIYNENARRTLEKKGIEPFLAEAVACHPRPQGPQRGCSKVYIGARQINQ